MHGEGRSNSDWNEKLRRKGFQDGFSFIKAGPDERP